MPHTTNQVMRLPPKFRRSLKSFGQRREVLQIMRSGGLTTVCEEARCPNIGECFSNKTATFMIMGDTCTRRCKFCSVKTGRPLKLDENEPISVALAAKKMGLDYVVITSVDRDELPDFGANHFAKVVEAIKQTMPSAKIEVLTPDFHARASLIDLVLDSPLDVFGHNIETVERLYKKLRPQSNFTTTQKVLEQAAKKPGVVVKSGMMVGVGESDDEILQNLVLLRDLGVNIVTIGQYLRPSMEHWPIDRYVGEKSYQKFIEFGLRLGFKSVFAGPFVRSSYHAKEALLKPQGELQGLS